MDHAQEQERLFETERYIAEAKALIARQRAVLERTARWGHPLDAAHATLDALESSLRMFENNRQRIHMMRKAARAIGEMKS